MQRAIGIVDELIQLHASAARQIKIGAVDEANFDLTAGCGLDYVALANRIADLDLNGSATRTREAAGTDRGLNAPDDFWKNGCTRPVFLPAAGSVEH
jgi:hypothetical protein